MPVQDYIVWGDDPLLILRTFRNLRLRRDRAQWGMDQADLQMIARAWERAAIAGSGDLEFLAEKKKFETLHNKLHHDSNEIGGKAGGIPPIILLDEPKDWPPVRTIDRAIQALEHAQIRTLH